MKEGVSNKKSFVNFIKKLNQRNSATGIIMSLIVLCIVITILAPRFITIANLKMFYLRQQLMQSLQLENF